MNMDFSIGIDIGGTNTDIGLVSCNGQCVARARISTAKYCDINHYTDDLLSSIRQLMHNNGVKIIKGIGIGAPNANYYNGCIDSAPNLNFKENFPICQMIQEKLGVKVIVTNDANAAAYGEMIYGGAKSLKHFIMVTLGTGVGSGFVINRQLVYGHDGHAGELGHTIILPEGRLCNCGRKGCVEQYVSARGIHQTFLEMAQEETYMGELMQLDKMELGCRVIANAAYSGDLLAEKVFEYTANLLGIALANAATFSSPTAIFLMGGLVNIGDIFLEPLQRSFEQNLLFVYKGKITLLTSELPANDASILGAAALIYGDHD